MATAEVSINSTNAEYGWNADTVTEGGGSTTNLVGRPNKKERAPLLSQKRLFRSLSGREISNENESTSSERTLGTFDGVFAPVCLSQFSSLLFLRVGFIVGNAGLFETTGMLVLAYLILGFTVLSICAVSTNGAVEGGGAYYMISRTLGPEFGGAIGALFYFANIFSSALYLTGCVEGIVQNFGSDGGQLANFLPEGRWYNFAYGSALNVLNMLVCFVGAGMFAKATVVILFGVLICVGSVIISFLALQHTIMVPIPGSNNLVQNATFHMNGTYTGLSWSTFKDNLYPDYSMDYTTETETDFALLFGVLFSGITGIMAGANMSGELKEPSRSIPLGTLMANGFTFITLLLLFTLTAATCSPYLLQNNYTYMMGINLSPYFVTIGVVTATLSAALSNIIGSSRVLAALVKDEIFGGLTSWIGRLTVGNNPIGAVLLSAIMVEGVLLIGSLNTIAKFTSIFFLLSYLSTNLATLGLEWASAPNFRPTFRYFSWWTCLLGIIGNGAMMFVISATEAGICTIVLLLLIIVLHLRSPSEEHQWGSISQALIFHQVRKYLLLLDSRKDHVKFWRPQMLLMVANPRSACPLIDFANDLKKSGLYVLGHVKVTNNEDSRIDMAAEDHPKWMALVDHLKVKAFVEVTVAKSVQEGLRHLVRISGLGAMKPNTILLGFCDNSPSHDFFTKESSPFNVKSYQGMPTTATSPSKLERTSPSLTPQEYVSMIADVLYLGKNIALCRHFHLLDKDAILRTSRTPQFIDVWPLDFFNPDESNIFDTTSLFLMQLATVLNMVQKWRKKTQLRVFLCVSSRDRDPEAQQKQVDNMLRELRINATIVTVPWDNIVTHLSQTLQSETEADSDSVSHISEDYINGVNRLILGQSIDTAVTFMYLPQPPESTNLYQRYLHLLTQLTHNLRPTIMVQGVSAVTTTNL